ncbi:MAG: DUF4923 family protein [Paludibacteraceae bacterium]
MKSTKFFFLFLLSFSILLTSCDVLSGVSGSSSSSKTTSEQAGSILNDIFDMVMGNAPLTQQNMIGTWNFQGTSCAFESANLLKKAGGEVVASQVEAKFDDLCKSMKISENNTNFIFNTDSSYTARIAGVKISGKYTIDPQNNKVILSYLMGMGHLNANVAVSSGKMQLLFDADSILKLMKFISQFTSNTSIEVLGKMADMYDGMLLGFDLKKQ